MNKISLIAAAVIATGAMLSQAEQVSFTGTATTSSPNGVPGSISVNVQKFDGTLGTLTGVTLSLVSGQQDAEMVLRNAGAASTWTVGLVGGAVTFSDGIHSTAATLTYSEQILVPAGTGPGQLTPSVTTIDRTLGIAATSQSYGPLANYIGNNVVSYVSDMTVDFAGQFLALGQGGGDGFNVITYTGTAQWEVTYTYEAVPEPTSLALLAVGCAALGLRRRARFTKKA